MKRATKLDLKARRIYSSMINWANRVAITIFIAISIFNTNFVWAQNSHYIDSQNGNDNNNGLSENSPWKSHTRIHCKHNKCASQIVQSLEYQFEMNDNPLIIGWLGAPCKRFLSNAPYLFRCSVFTCLLNLGSTCRLAQHMFHELTWFRAAGCKSGYHCNHLNHSGLVPGGTCSMYLRLLCHTYCTVGWMGIRRTSTRRSMVLGEVLALKYVSLWHRSSAGFVNGGLAWLPRSSLTCSFRCVLFGNTLEYAKASQCVKVHPKSRGR